MFVWWPFPKRGTPFSSSMISVFLPTSLVNKPFHSVSLLLFEDADEGTFLKQNSSLLLVLSTVFFHSSFWYFSLCSSWYCFWSLFLLCCWQKKVPQSLCHCIGVWAVMFHYKVCLRTDNVALRFSNLTATCISMLCICRGQCVDIVSSWVVLISTVSFGKEVCGFRLVPWQNVGFLGFRIRTILRVAYLGSTVAWDCFLSVQPRKHPRWVVPKAFPR